MWLEPEARAAVLAALPPARAVELLAAAPRELHGSAQRVQQLRAISPRAGRRVPALLRGKAASPPPSGRAGLASLSGTLARLSGGLRRASGGSLGRGSGASDDGGAGGGGWRERAATPTVRG